MLPRNVYHGYITRSTYHYAYARQTQVIWKIPIAVPGVATPETKQLISAVIHKQESKHEVPESVLRAVLGRIQFTLHATRRTPHIASRLVQAMSAWLVKTRRARFRHSKDARVYGHTTTAMHKLSNPPTHTHTQTPPPSPTAP